MQEVCRKCRKALLGKTLRQEALDGLAAANFKNFSEEGAIQDAHHGNGKGRGAAAIAATSRHIQLCPEYAIDLMAYVLASGHF
eukprot:981561-Pelagomonas_calceolata.AAC.2